VNHCEGLEEQVVYQVRVRGVIDSRWSDWFDGLSIRPQENGDTLLTGPVRDQAALHGLLAKIRDLGLPLLSVRRIWKDVGWALGRELPCRVGGARN